jgi:hypothetical protein
VREHQTYLMELREWKKGISEDVNKIILRIAPFE